MRESLANFKSNEGGHELRSLAWILEKIIALGQERRHKDHIVALEGATAWHGTAANCCTGRDNR